ncbi:MAG: molecular chaperone DnaJ [Holosporaceae bacterium]|jgi:molecular chaperone DnaJ|nr:molecular chaperone DnaJ [Holosporaceae bacterium]
MDYYETLGVSRSASDADIKKAYRQMAMKYHPDRNKGDKTAEAKFKSINEAYETLKDPQKKAAYDRFGHDAYKNASSNGGGGANRGGFNPGGFSSQEFHFDFGGGGSPFSDIFDSFFGDGMSSAAKGERAEMRGESLRYEASITLEEAFRGKDIELSIRTNVKCDACKGTGSEGGTAPRTCPHCRGTGRTRFTQGFFTVERTCAACNGTGHIIEKSCKVCNGAGRLSKPRTIKVSIPAGIENGAKIRLAGEGEAGLRGGRSGDLYIIVAIKPHKLFVREGSSIYCDIPISFVTATLGGEVDVPTIEGKKVSLKIPAGAQSGQILKLRGRGMSLVRSSSRGDMMARIIVETPTNLTDRQKELLREFDQDRRSSPKSESFFSKVKDFWQEL